MAASKRGPLFGFIEAARALMGQPADQADPPKSNSLTEASMRAIRKALGGQLQLMPVTRPRWLLADLETAQAQADGGSMDLIGQLWRSMRRDGMISGLLKTRTSGLVALPKRFRGNPGLIDALTADNASRTVFDEMFPPAELALIAADGIGPGIGIGELVPVAGRDYPKLVRLDPTYLTYRWNEARWYFQSVGGMLPVTPGDGRWILHCPGGSQYPWHWGDWRALGRAFITKEHAMLHRGNFSGKLANPARVVHAPQAATEEQRLGFLARLAAWGINSVFALPPGWKAELLESNGRGWEVFQRDIDTADLEVMIVLAGQVVTVTGGTGFANADIHKLIRADLIAQTALDLAHTINTQGLPLYAWQQGGEQALAECPRVSWDTKPPEDRETESKALGGLGDVVGKLRPALADCGLALDVEELAHKFGAPLLVGKDADAALQEAEDAAAEEQEQALAEAEAKGNTDGPPPPDPKIPE